MARLDQSTGQPVEGPSLRHVRHHGGGPPSSDLAWQASVEDMEAEAARTACRRSQAAATIGSPSVHSRDWKPTADPRTRATAAELRARRYEHRPASERQVHPGSLP